LRAYGHQALSIALGVLGIRRTDWSLISLVF
jgi:hypothetical protein